MKTCGVLDCDGAHYGRGMCKRHYLRVWRHGSLVLPRDARSHSPERFWQHIQMGNPEECWLWTGTRPHGKYGQISIGGKRVPAHRQAYALTKGPIPDGVDVCHSCDNPPCCNPNHLWLGSRKDNLQDMARKHRRAGERQAMHKLTEDDVKTIRARYAKGETQAALGAEFGVGQAAISLIVLRQRWTHI